MRPVFYEIRRTLSSKFVILMIVAIIGLSSLLAYESAASFNSSPVTARTPSVAVGYYISGSTMTFVTYAHNDFGGPFNGLSVNVSYDNVIKSGASDSHGFANLSFNYVQGVAPQLVTYNYSYSIFGLRQHPASSQSYIIPGINYSGFTIIRGIISSTNSSNLGIQLLYVGPDGASAPETSVYIAPYPSNTYSMTSVEAYNNYTTNVNYSGVSVKTIFPVFTGDQYNETYALAIANKTGSFISQTNPNAAPLGRLSTYTPMTQTILQSLVQSGIGSILGLLIPILGVFAGYLTYGKDKTTGVLESVLKRPVTRGGLITSRFFANSVSIIGSVIISMVIGDLIIHHYFHLYLTTYFTLFFIWTYVVEGLAFLALVYMFTHMVKSQGALLGISITLFVLLGLFWQIIPAVIELAMGIGAQSSIYIPLTLGFNLASPSGYSNLVSFFFTNRIGTIAQVSANPATFGIVEYSLVIVGLLWILVPFLIAFALARRSD